MGAAQAFAGPRSAAERSFAARGRPAAPRPARAQVLLGNQARLRRLSAVAPALQAKIAIGAADHPLEREADAAADAVMAMGPGSVTARSPISPAPPGLSRKCSACEEEDKAAGGGVMARKAAAPGPTAPAEAPALVHKVLGGSGTPLDAGARGFFEPRFGADFSAVRVHAGAEAAASAAAVNARAYTVGSHIVLAGAAEPRLMAHELAHVVQQSGGAEPALRRDSTPQLPVDPCITVPIFGKLCGQAAIDAYCKVRHCGPSEKPKTQCPPYFQPARTQAHQGECCPEGQWVDSEGHPVDPKTYPGKAERSGTDGPQCCTPDRIPRGSVTCCPDVVSDDKCVKSSDIPPIGDLCLPWQKTASGQCCVPPLVSDGLKCVFPPAPQAPPTKPPTSQAAPDALILFQQDHPAPGERDPAKVLTPAGAAALASLTAQMKASATTQVRLVGHASSEGAADYNQALAGRRVAFVASSLGLPASRYADPPTSDGAEKGCAPVSTGQWSCGETRADQSSANPADRNVQVSFILPQGGQGSGAQGGGASPTPNTSDKTPAPTGTGP